MYGTMRVMLIDTDQNIVFGPTQLDLPGGSFDIYSAYALEVIPVVHIEQ